MPHKKCKGKGRKKVKYVMGEFKRGTLRSGSGHKVTQRPQALAIAMSEAGLSKKKRRRKTLREYASKS